MFSRGCLATLIFFVLSASLRAQDGGREGLEFFEKKIRPLLAENCFRCHSEKKQKGKLALHTRAGMLKGGQLGPAIVPGEPEKSLLIKAIRYEDAKLRMPRDGKLANERIADLTAWIAMGAPWPKDQGGTTVVQKEFNLKERAQHWSLQPLRRLDPPKVKDAAWVKSPIDSFILHKLEAEGLTPAGPADRRTLLRRVTYDLIGLPPTPAEIDAFLKDNAPNAFARVVDRLLGSPHYGERWGRHWLDLVRFAETYGHEFDPDIPDAYKYRDYVIRAFNEDVPFNEFVMEHIAGDLLPKPRRHVKDGTNESVLGTAFWWLGEAKHSPVDVRGDQADRMDNQIDVFGKAFLGMTIACARCHDHKFDAISTADYYALAGYLQSSRMARVFLDDPEPRQKILKRMEALQSDLLRTGRSAAAGELEKHLEELAGRMPIAKDPGPAGALTFLHDGKKPLSAEEFAAKRRAALANLQGQKERADKALAKAIVFADARDDSFRTWIGQGEAMRSLVDLGPLPVNTQQSVPGSPLLDHRAIHSGRISHALQGAIRSPTFVIGKKRIHLHAAGSQIAARVVVDGLQLIQDPIYGGLKQNIDSKEMRWFSFNVSMWEGHRAYIELLDDGPGHLALDRVVFSDDGPPPDPPNPLVMQFLLLDEKAVMADDLVAKYLSEFKEILAAWNSGRLDESPDAVARLELLNWMLGSAKVNPYRRDLQNQKDALEEVRKLEASLPPPRRALATVDGSAVDEQIFLRGNHKTLGDSVPRRFLEVFGGKGSPGEKGSGRLDLAGRMIDPRQTPNLPRVIINRLWKHHFGEGIVRSPDDFGVLGQTPSHPELLDFLASDFVRNGGSIKDMHKIMVLSSTYQMASQPAPVAADGNDPAEVDPDNRWLWRMPIRRLEAEPIRDAMLMVSGRLDRALFGPSVPPHLTPFMLGRGRPGASGPLDGNGRRGIYLGVRRNFLNPMFLAFDYPTPFSTMGRRGVSNVPAQALTMMNNPFVLQQAELWGKNVVGEKDLNSTQRLTKMYVSALGRLPSDGELREAQAYLDANTANGELRAWSDIAHVLFNVKEFIFIK